MVFEAFVDPSITLTSGSEPGKRILIEWNVPETVVGRMDVRDKGRERTFVKIQNWGFSGNAEEVVAKALNSTGGFNLVLAGAKFFLEHGVEPDLVVDHAPDALVAGWSRRG